VTVYLLLHYDHRDYYNTCVELLGVYTLYERAVEAMRRAKASGRYNGTLAGDPDYVDELHFHIDEVEVNRVPSF
jgi:hypothetical protein